MSELDWLDQEEGVIHRGDRKPMTRAAAIILSPYVDLKETKYEEGETATVSQMWTKPTLASPHKRLTPWLK